MIKNGENVKTEFSFCSTAFNCTVSKDYFINDGCFGDDLAEWMMGELRNRGYETGENPGQEDFGWYFTFEVEGVEHCVVLSFQPNNPARGDRWLGWVERNAGFFGSILGGRSRGVLSESTTLVDSILRSSPEIYDLTWNPQ